MVDVERLRAVAEAPSDGPWGVASTDGMGCAVHRGEHDTIALYATRWDATHIATFDPPTVLVLLDEIQSLRARVAELEES